MGREALVVVPNFMTERGDLDTVLAMLASLKRTEPDIRCVVVDDFSPEQDLVDELRDALDKLDWALWSKSENEGFSKAVNVGLGWALDAGWDAVLINADIELESSGWLQIMQQQSRLDGPELADVVGALLLYPNGTIQHAGTYFSLLSRCFEHLYKYGPANLPEALVPRACPVTGAFQFIRHETLASIGLYDEDFSMGWEDVSYCTEVFKAGGQCVYQPGVRAVHFESMFRGRPSDRVRRWQAESWAQFVRKHGSDNFAPWVPTFV